jgi:hypothetical protein
MKTIVQLYRTIPEIIQAIPVLLFIGLLAQHEIVRAMGSPRGRTWNRWMLILIIPVGIAAMLVIALRFAVIMRV